MNERVGEVTTAHTHTFDWVFTNSETGFADWLHSNKSLFWITGKPSSGKSTLMKYLVQDSRTQKALSKQDQRILSMPSFFSTLEESKLKSHLTGFCGQSCTSYYQMFLHWWILLLISTEKIWKTAQFAAGQSPNWNGH